MTQEFQMIGGMSPELEAVAREKQGWQGEIPEPSVEEQTDSSDWSRRDRWTNMQALGRSIDNMAGHTETSMAGIVVEPPGSVELPPERDFSDPGVTY
jgi:hypothetical protein